MDKDLEDWVDDFFESRGFGDKLRKIREANHLRIEEVLKQLECTREGLSSHEATKRLQLHGPNKFEKKKGMKLLKLLGFMWNPLAWFMELAALLAVILAVGSEEPSDLIAFISIMVLLVVNAFICFILEPCDGEEASNLVDAAIPKSMVLRDGKWCKVNTDILVPGDIVSIKSGDVVCADICLLNGDYYLFVEEYEANSHPFLTRKYPGQVVYYGTVCYVGDLQGIVVATGNRTSRGKVSRSFIYRDDHCTYILKVVCRVCTYLVFIAMGIAVIAIYGVHHRKCKDGIKNLIALLIGGVPIAMPTIFSIIMSMGSHKLSQKGIIVKYVSAIDVLSRMDVLCTSKTGILTVNKPLVLESLTKVFAKDMKIKDVILFAAMASSTYNPDAVDAAIGEILDPRKARAGNMEVHTHPFGLLARRRVVTYFDADGNQHRACKGNPDEILDLCGFEGDLRDEVYQVIDDISKHGLRPLAIARQDIPESTQKSGGTPWELVGLVLFYDPLRDGTVEAISRLLKLGVNVKMTSGDQFAVVREICQRLRMGEKIYTASLLDEECTTVTHDRQLELIEEADGFAGLTRDNIITAVGLLQEKHVCGMLGYGARDFVPLLHADIRITLSDSCDTAKSISDIILTGPSLDVISYAIRISRAIFQNRKGYIIFSLSSAIHIVLSFIFINIIWAFLISPSMVLLLAFLSNGLALAIPKDFVKSYPPPEHWKLKEIIVIGGMFGVCLAYITVIFFWVMRETEFFSVCFKVRSLSDNNTEMMTALFLQVSIMSQFLLFVNRPCNWSIVEHPGYLLILFSFMMQTAATIVAVHADWSFADMKGIGWGWAGVIWLYNAFFSLSLGYIKFVGFFIAKHKYITSLQKCWRKLYRLYLIWLPDRVADWIL